MARILGLVSISLGDPAVDGGMSTSLTAIGDTKKDSCQFTETDATKTEFFIEESDDAVESFVSQKGVESVTWDTYNTTPQNLQRLFGGTVTGTGVLGDPYIWQPPATQTEVEQSIKIIDRHGNIFEIVRAKLSCKKNISFKATELGAVSITATILTPLKANTAKYKFTAAV